MKGSQVGDEVAWVGYVIHHAPGPVLAVQPSVELAKRFSQQRIDPLIEERIEGARRAGRSGTPEPVLPKSSAASW